MSGFAFSHQFSKRWLTTPTPVKHAIIQELDDIAELLQPETDLQTYRFSVPNLNEKVEELLSIERAHQEKIEAKEQQRLEQEKLERERLEAERLEQARIEQERLEAERIEQERLQAEQQAQAELVAEQERLQLERQAQDDEAIAALEQERAIAKQAYLAKQPQLAKQANLAQQAIQFSTSSINFATDDIDDLANWQTSNVAIERHSDDTLYAIDSTAEPVTAEPIASVETTETSETTTPTELTNTASIPVTIPPDLEQIKQDIVIQLQSYIDNYLLESMTFMNEDLHKWLKTEVEKQLNERLSQTD